MTVKWKRWSMAAVALVAALSIAGCQVIPAPGAGAEVEATETAVVRQGTLLVTIEGTGSLIPRDEVSVSFSTTGRAAEVFVDEGQVVEAGQPLVQLETADLALQVAQAEAALAAAESELGQLLAPPRPEDVAVQEANLRAMEAQVNAAAADRNQVGAGPDAGEIAAAASELASAIVDQKSAFDRHESTMQCKKIAAGTTFPGGKVLSEDMIFCPALGVPEEQARYNLEAADAALIAAQAQLDELTGGPDPDQLRASEANVWTVAAQRDAAQAQLDLLLAGAMAEEIQTAEASVVDARAALEQAQLALERATLMAPIAGTVTRLDIQPGEIANANQLIVVLSDLVTLELEANLDETEVARVMAGQEARVTLDAFPGTELVGEVTQIASVAQSGNGAVVYPVTVRLEPSDLPVRAGMTADASIVTASQAGALIVPLRAVHAGGGQQPYVERLVGDQVERVAVTLGLMTEMEIEVTGGLSAGDVVIVVTG